MTAFQANAFQNNAFQIAAILTAISYFGQRHSKLMRGLTQGKQ